MSRKVIIVDDSKVSRLFLKSILSQNGFDVIGTFQNAEDFLEYYSADQTADIVLMDLVLPRMSGYEAIKKAKEMNRKVKIFVVSSLGDSPPEITKALQAGASNVIVKPFVEKSFIELIDSETAPEDQRKKR